MFIDGDFPTNKECEYHCSPTCHPGQIDEKKWKYGCLHKAWPQNKYKDFCPLVDCDGDIKKCELKNTKLLGRYVGGKKRSITHLEKKLKERKSELSKATRLKET